MTYTVTVPRLATENRLIPGWHTFLRMPLMRTDYDTPAIHQTRHLQARRIAILSPLLGTLADYQGWLIS